MTQVGVYNLGSLLFLTAVVVISYSAAREPDAGVGLVARRALGRAGRLLGVMLGLGIVVHLMTR